MTPFKYSVLGHVAEGGQVNMVSTIECLLKQECLKFEKLGRWYHSMDSEWAAGMFFMPKKTGDIRVNGLKRFK